MLIEAKQVRKSYGKTEALRGVDLEVRSGGIVGLLGPNGAGKTTFVEIVEGLRIPTSGTVTVLGLDPTKAPRDLKERIGVQLQSTSIMPELKVHEVLSLFGSLYAKQLPLETVLSWVGLEEKRDAIVSTLSGGQKQRLAIGMALVHDPEFILLDEPTTGLDPQARRELQKVILGLKERGRSVLLTTHYIEEAELLCDRVIVLREGAIVADDHPRKLLGRAMGRSTVWIEVEGEFDPAPLIHAGAEAQGRDGKLHRFATTDPAAFVVALGPMLESGRFTLTDLQLKRPNLEDVYLELVGANDGGER